MKALTTAKYLRLIAALCLCLAMILPVLSCAETDLGNEADNTTASANAATTPPENTDPEETSYPFLDVNYAGEEFLIFNSEQKYYMLMNVLVEEETGEAVSDAQYSAMIKVEEAYNIDLVEYYCGWDNQYNEIMNVCSTGEDLYDVAYLRSTHIGSMFTSSYLYNLYDIQSFNIDAPWWNQVLKDDATLLGNHLYYLSSDAHLMAFEGTWGIYFNKGIAENIGMPSFYDEVYNNTWTLERLTELAKQGASQNGDISWEFDGNGSSVYGLASFKNLINALMVGCNEHYCLKDSDGVPYYAMMNSQTVYDVADAIAALTGATAEGAYISANSTGKHYTKDIFSQNRALFMGGELKAGASELKEMTNAYGILPIPKYNSEQENYLSNMYWGSLLLTIPTTCADPERTATVMDALSYYAWRDVLPVYYERLCYRGMSDAESVAMLEIISNTRYLNWAIAYDWIDSIEPQLNTDLDAGRSNTVSALIKSSSRLVQMLIEKTLADFENSQK